MRTLHFPVELIRDYYTNDFGIDLRQYFEIKPMVGHREIAFIGHLDWHFNPHRKCDGAPACRVSLSDFRSFRFGAPDIPDVKNETEKNFIFAGIFYFLVLVPQTLREMFGEDVEYAFYRCTGWPLVSAGLGGYILPEQMLMEAALMPCEVERENFHRMLSAVMPFMNGEIRRFFQRVDGRNLHEETYRKMIDLIGERCDEFLNRIESESNAFMKSFSDA